MTESPPSRRLLTVLVGLGLAWRLFVAARTDMPREDGVNYLWMAERFAAGDPAAALGEVFSPLLALVIAVPIACGIEPFLAGQLALAVAGALVVIPVALLAEALRPGLGRWAALLVFVATRPTVLGAQIYTEPLFLLTASCAFLAGVRQRYLWCGGWAAVAFWVRPEAAVLPLAFLPGDRRAWRAAVPLVAGVALLAGWRGLCGHGWHPVPKLPFIQAHNVAADQGWLERLAQLPPAFCEAFWPLAILAVLGVWKWRPRPLLWVLLFAAVILWAYVPRRRFFVNWLFAVAPLAAAGLLNLPRLPLPAWRRWQPEASRWGWVGVVVALQLVLAATGGSDADRIVERRIGEQLRVEIAPGETVAGDMTRVIYFAGFRPLPPRHFTAEELVAAGRDARFVVLRGRREYAVEVERRLTGHRRWPIPPALRSMAASRGLVVLERR